MKKITSNTNTVYQYVSVIRYLKKYANDFKIIDELNKHLKVDGNKVIVINFVRSYAFFALLFETVLAVKLNKIGYKVYILVDDGILPTRKLVRLKNYLVVKLFLRNKNHYIRYSQLLSKKDVIKAKKKAKTMIENDDYTLHNINLWPNIYASVIRYFHSASGFVELEKDYVKILNLCTRNAILSYFAAQYIHERMNPDVVITSHGIYSMWGPFMDYFRISFKKVITYDFGSYKNNSVILSKKSLPTCDDGFFDKFKNTIDNYVAEMEVKKIFNNRFNYNYTDQRLFKNVFNDEDITLNITKKFEGKKIYAIFPNLLWDASLIDTNNIFNTAEEWLFETVEYRHKTYFDYIFLSVNFF